MTFRDSNSQDKITEIRDFNLQELVTEEFTYTKFKFIQE